MNRSARIGGLLALILLICGVVIALDQTHVLGGTSTGTTNTTPAQNTTTPPGSGGGYGDLK